MTAKKTRTILFVCTGNACRSQIAEGFARAFFPHSWRIYSAGVLASGVHPMSIETMREVGIDISSQRSKHLEEIPLREVDHIVTLCGHARDSCPTFPHAISQEHWPIDDPIFAAGTAAAAEAFRRVREDIRARMEDLVRRLTEGDS